MSGVAPPRPFLLRLPALAVAGAVALSWRAVDGDVGALASREALAAVAGFARGFWPPAHDRAFLALLARPLGETVAIAFLGLCLAAALALPLALLAVSPAALATRGARPGALRRAAWLGARGLLDVMRSVPELVWALVFVRAVGLGPAAGVLAIAVGYAGVLGKVYAEILESAPRAPARTLAAAGASPLAALAFALVPPSAPVLASYTLYRLDCALRASAVLGLVGAGGIGTQLELSMRMLAYDEVAAMVLALFALVGAVDLLSAGLRRLAREGRGPFPVGRAALAVRAAALLAVAGAAAACALALGLPLADLASARPLRAAGAFFAAGWPPTVEPRFLRALLQAVAETLAVSVVGTALAAAIGLALAVPAALGLHGAEARGARRLPLAAAAWAARALANLARTLPELLWALAIIFAVGLGPFAGALALGIHTGGVLGRLYAEALEEVQAGPVAALRRVGASGPAAAVFAVLPQALPQLVAYTLYRWEVNVRASAVLGVVGAGGVGALLHVALSLFHGHDTLALVLAILALVTAVDLLSGALRRRLVDGPGEGTAAARGVGVPAVAEGW